MSNLTKKYEFFWMILILIGLLCISLPSVYEEKLKENLGGEMDVEITYPEKIVGREDTTSI